MKNYMDMSVNELIKLIEEKDKRISELEFYLRVAYEHLASIGTESNVKDCSTCKNHNADIPHTCDICTSLDQEEEYGMWEGK